MEANHLADLPGVINPGLTRHEVPGRATRREGEVDAGPDGQLVALDHLLDTIEVNHGVVGVAGNNGPVLVAGHTQELDVALCLVVRHGCG